jgi:protein-L-isoaspartate O-methyltransferase
MVPTRTISDDARKVLARCVLDHDTVTVPNDEHGKPLERRLYQEINAVLEALGGVWTRKRRAHVFTELTGEDLADRFYTIVETGSWERAQDAGYYPTPEWLVEQMIAAAAIEGFHRVLEPSAGQGAILTKVAPKLQSRHQLAICELLPANQKVLEQQGFTVDAGDFLEFATEPIFDRILMNPPFGKSAAPRHVQHAMTMLKPGGRLVAVMPNGIMQRQDALHRAVRQQIILHGAIAPLPEDTFKDAGTGVRTVLVVYDRPKDAVQPPISRPVPVQDVQQAQDAPQKPLQATEVPKASENPQPRFKRLSEAPRRFKRPARRGGVA